jgi:hypothetical protein
MIFDSDIECVKKLINPAKKVIAKGSPIAFELFEKRVQLWNEIKENQESYEDGTCGKILDDLDRYYRATFDYALLLLSKSFRENGDDFPPSQIFSNDEFEICNRIEKYNVFEISTKQDIKKKVILKDKNLLGLFEEYYGTIDAWIDQTIEDPKIRLTLRYFLKKKWQTYKQKINEAINELINELDWFRILVNEWTKLSTPPIEPPGKIEPKPEEIIVESGPRFTEIGDAKFYENNFIGRIKNKLHGKIKIAGKKFKVEDVKVYSDVNISKHLTTISEKQLQNLPENKYIIAGLIKKRFFRKEKILFKAQFCCRVEKYAKNCLDTYPLELVDINPAISVALEEAKNQRMLLCLASPTGFTKDVENHIGGKDFQKNFLSIVSVCLVDLVTGKIIINPHDKTAKEFKELFLLETNEEQVAKAKTQITETLLEKGGVLLNDIIKRYGHTKQIVEKAFYDLREEKGYTVKYRKEFGTLVLMRE